MGVDVGADADGSDESIEDQAEAEGDSKLEAETPSKGVAVVDNPLGTDSWDRLDIEDLHEPSEEAAEGHFGWLVLGGVVALLLLVGQVFWYQFDEWSRDPMFRPVYANACAVLGCELPEMRSVEQIEAAELIVRTHTDVENALMVDAIIINRAAYPQVFPIVELRFSAVGGTLVAARRFSPSEYLAGELEGVAEMAPNTPIHIGLEIEDPGPDAMNYIMLFR